MVDLQRLHDELRRRKVFRVAAGYAIAGVAVIAAAADILPALRAPEWLLTTVVVVVLAGFPVALVLSWVFELSAGRIRRTLSGEAATGERPNTAPLVGLVVAGVVVAALGSVAAWAILVDAAAGEGDPALVAVLPFATRGAGVEHWSDGMVDLLSRKIDASGELRSADPNAVLGALGDEEDGHRGVQAGSAAARRLGAGLFVLGSATAVGERLHLQATLYAPDGERLADAEVGPVPEDSVPGAVDELARRLLAPRLTRDAGQLAGLAAITTHSVSALRAYLEGERLLRRHEVGAARTAFQEAVAVDSLFALGWYGLAIAESWAGSTALESVRRASALMDQLPPLERRLIEARRAYMEGRYGEAERTYRAVLAQAPETLEAHHELGEVLLHFGAFTGRSGFEAREHFERALAIRPKHGPSLNHLINVVAAEGRAAEVDSLTKVAVALAPANALSYEAQRALARRDSAALHALMPRLATREHAAGRGLFLAAASMAGEARALRALRLAEAAEPDASRAARFGDLLDAAQLQLALGRPRAGLAEYEKIALPEMAPGVARMAERLAQLLPTFPWYPATDEALQAAGESLIQVGRMEWESRPGVRPGEDPRPDEDPYVPFLLLQYNLGRAHAFMGDFGVASRYAAKLDSLPDPADEFFGSIREDLAWALRAWIQLRKGEPEVALARLERMPMQVTQRAVNLGLDHGEERYLRARLLAETGRTDEAIRWLEGFLAFPTVKGVIHRAPVLLELGRIHDRRGDREAAIRAYAAFIELWRDPDPELRPMREEAVRRLAALRGEG